MGRGFSARGTWAGEQPLGLSRRHVDGGGRQRSWGRCGLGRWGQQLVVAGLLHPQGWLQRRGRPCRRGRLAVGLTWRSRGRSGQRDAGGLGEDQLAALVLESREQADPPLGATGRVPGQPEAVRRSQTRIAAVMRQILCGEQELLLGFRLVWVGAIIIERVHTQGTFDRYGFAFVSLGKEHYASAKTADDGLAGLVQGRIGPYGQDAVGGLGLGVRFEERQRLVHVPLGAAGCSEERRQAQPEDAATVSSCVRAISHHRLGPKCTLVNWTAVVRWRAVLQASAARRSAATG